MLEPIRDILRSKHILLASSSPRRKEILENLNLTFEVKKSDFEENLDKSKFVTPNEYVKLTALHKTQDVVRKMFENNEKLPDIVIGADTVVYLDNKIIEKPVDKKDAIHLLSILSSRVHSVCTGVVLMVAKDKKTGQVNNPSLLFDLHYDVITFEDVTQVEFDLLSDEVIRCYVETGEPMDKAGGYGIQGLGGSLIKRIDGDYFNVMGLPSNKLCKELARSLTLNQLC